MNDIVKLPKQWEHWCRDMKLKPHGSSHWSKRRDNWFYLQGRGHYWRVNCHGEFQRGDTYEEFDRWALCDIESVPMPTSRAEFRRAVLCLLQYDFEGTT